MAKMENPLNMPRMMLCLNYVADGCKVTIIDLKLAKPKNFLFKEHSQKVDSKPLFEFNISTALV